MMRETVVVKAGLGARDLAAAPPLAGATRR
jgi:hypothetical protein